MTAQLTLNLSYLQPGASVFPRIVGSAVESGGSLSGVTSASDATGGGLIAIDYTEFVLGNTDPGTMRLMNQLSVALAGGVRSIVVPFLVDWISPYNFTTSTSFPSGFVSGAQAVGSGTISVSVIGGTGVLTGGEWFQLYTSGQGYRAYCVTDIDSMSVVGGNNLYTVGIRPTLRDAVSDGAAVSWWRPQCTMRLAPGFSADITVTEWWRSTPSLKFIEYFGQ